LVSLLLWCGPLAPRGGGGGGAGGGGGGGGGGGLPCCPVTSSGSSGAVHGRAGEGYQVKARYQVRANPLLPRVHPFGLTPIPLYSPQASTLAARVGAFSPQSLCHFATQGLLPPVAILGSASPCPCVWLCGFSLPLCVAL